MKLREIQSYKLTNGDEIIAHHENGKTLDIACRHNAKLSTLNLLGIEPGSVGRHLATSGSFLSSTRDPNEVWQSIKRWIPTSEYYHP